MNTVKGKNFFVQKYLVVRIELSANPNCSFSFGLLINTFRPASVCCVVVVVDESNSASSIDASPIVSRASIFFSSIEIFWTNLSQISQLINYSRVGPFSKGTTSLVSSFENILVSSLNPSLCFFFGTK